MTNLKILLSKSEIEKSIEDSKIELNELFRNISPNSMSIFESKIKEYENVISSKYFLLS
jgi:tmRNA-binding protein